MILNFLKRFALLLLIALFSCKKDGHKNFADKKTSLPNYGNIHLKDVFSREENTLQNEDSVKAVLNNYYKNIWEGNDLSGGLLVAKGNNIIFEKYRGFARENNSMPIGKDTPMHVASVSKTMTAMAALKLVEAGKIGLNDPLSKYFPGFPYPKVTIFTLLSQRSGLPKYEYMIEKISPQPAELSKQFLTNQDILNILIKYKPDLARETNTGFMYCNTNFALLGLLVEKISRKPFPEAMQEILFRQLDMKDTYIFTQKDIANASQSFYYRGNKLYPIDRLDLIYGDKNVYTTPRDLLNFSTALFSENFLRQDLKKMIFEPYSNEKPGMNNYGLGFRMKIFDNGEKLTYHNGWWHGSNAVFAHLLKSKVTIVAIGNKYSQKVYSALALSSLFEKFPLEADKLNQTLGIPQDSAKESADAYLE